MNINQRVKIEGTNTFWDGKEGILEEINEDAGTCTVFVDFNPEEGKRIRQDFHIENIEESLSESLKNINTDEIGDIVKDYGNGYGLFQSKDGKKSTVSLDDLEEVEDEPVDTGEVLKLEQAPSFVEDLDELDSEGRFNEFSWILDDEGGSAGILRLKGLDEAIKCGRVEIETRSGNQSVINPNGITVYALKKGKGSGNQFRAYFFRKGNTCVFVRGHIKKQDKNSSEEYKCIQDTINYATNS